jgi:tetratricopeptide (TPR) repeat protein
MLPLTLGQIYFELNDAKTAITWFERSGDHPYVPVRLSRAYRSLGAENTAVRILLEAKEKNHEAAVELEIELLRRAVAVGEPNALHNLGLALWQAGHRQEGRTLLKEAAQSGDQLAAQALHGLRRKRRKR